MFILFPFSDYAPLTELPLYTEWGHNTVNHLRKLPALYCFKKRKTKYTPKVDWISPKQLKYRHSIMVSSVMNAQR